MEWVLLVCGRVLTLAANSCVLYEGRSPSPSLKCVGLFNSQLIYLCPNCCQQEPQVHVQLMSSVSAASVAPPKVVSFAAAQDWEQDVPPYWNSQVGGCVVHSVLTALEQGVRRRDGKSPS